MLKTPGQLQEFLFEYAMGNSIMKSLAAIGGKSEQTIANWRRASRKAPADWIVHWPPDRSGQAMPFHEAFDCARQWGRLAAQSELERDLRTRLYELQTKGPARSKPETVFTPGEWQPPEGIGRGGPPPPPPQPNPRAYIHDPGTRPQQPPEPRRVAPLNRPGIGTSEPPRAGRFSMSERMGVHREYSRAERRAGLPRITQFGVTRD
jgi:hypothetical protein